jgi:hypothetical protein
VTPGRAAAAARAQPPAAGRGPPLARPGGSLKAGLSAALALVPTSPQRTVTVLRSPPCAQERARRQGPKALEKFEEKLRKQQMKKQMKRQTVKMG